MQRTLFTQALAMSLCLGLFIKPIKAHADDIDIFTGASAGSAINPRILIVLDNTSNWSRQNQQWPDGSSQGQSEVNAIKTVVSTLDSSVNLGLMEYVTAGNANTDGGFIRYAVKPMDATNKTAFSSILTTIGNNITSPNEKINSGTPYGNLMYDVYNYFAGANSYTPTAVDSSRADSDGYTTNYTTFKSPLTEDNTCGKSYMIFIGNPASNGPTSDTSANTARLAALGGVTTPLSLPNFVSTTVTSQTQVGTTSACYANATAAAAELSNFTAACSSYDSCAIGNTTTPSSAVTCDSGTRAYSVVRTVTTPSSTTVAAGTPVVGTPVTTSGTTTNYYGSASAVDANADHGSLSCPSNTTVVNGTTTTTTTYSCTYAVGAAAGNASASTSALSTSCYTGLGTQNQNYWDAGTSTDRGGLTCPANASCTYGGVMTTDVTGCSGQRKHVNVTQTATYTTRQYTVTQTATPTTTSSEPVTTPAGTTSSTLGYTAQCYATAPSSTNDFASECSATNASCTYGNNPTATTATACAAGSSVYKVMGSSSTITNVATTGSTLDNSTLNADEWARFMHDKGIPIPNSTTTIRPSVLTYTIDVHNAQPNATHTSLLLSMAKVGGGKYFQAKNEAAIVTALKQIISEILAVNSVFASSSLPVSATNRSQNENQVFIGMFRPDPDSKPRWFGNLKRYKLITSGDAITLGDNSTPSIEAINTTTGFITPCAKSWWTVASDTYWSGLGINPEPAGTCPSSSVYSDAPDGPLVEKGAVAQMLRNGNNPSASTPTYAVNRTMYTVKDGALATFNTTNVTIESIADDNAKSIRFIKGEDVNAEKYSDGVSTRPSIHGDVIHSRPLPVNYGSTTGVVVFYGANDGQYRAVAADSGKELWSLVAPEFNSRLARLRTNSPLVTYPGTVLTGTEKKDYFWDGSTGIFQNKDNSKVWLFPTMRRGGRMIYALNVTTPAAPALMWAKGCPNLSNDTGCTDGWEDIGQTWSMPQVAFLKGYSDTEPVLIVGGGYDNCEDTDNVNPGCGTTGKGNVIYVIKASDGTIIKSFTLDTNRGIAGDIALVDVNSDSKPDYAYAADMGGTIHRVDFISGPSGTALTSDNWAIYKVGYTSGSHRKFLNSPAVALNAKKVYIALGSGDREHPLSSSYPYTTPVSNRFYVLLDDLAVKDSSEAVNLDTMANYSVQPDTNPCGVTRITPASGLKGWYMTLPGVGEQTVTSASIVAGQVAFSTNKPTPPSTNTCSNPLGEAKAYLVSLFNASGAIGVTGTCGGDRSSVVVGGGLPPSSVVAASVRVGDRNETVLIGGGQKSKKPTVSTDGQKVEPNVTSNRNRSYTYTKGQ